MAGRSWHLRLHLLACTQIEEDLTGWGGKIERCRDQSGTPCHAPRSRESLAVATTMSLWSPSPPKKKCRMAGTAVGTTDTAPHRCLLAPGWFIAYPSGVSRPPAVSAGIRCRGGDSRWAVPEYPSLWAVGSPCDLGWSGSNGRSLSGRRIRAPPGKEWPSRRWVRAGRGH